MSFDSPYIVEHKNPRWQAVAESAIAFIRQAADAGDLMVKVSETVRSLDQNQKMWPMLADFSKQVQWPINGEYQLISKEDWKSILTAAFEKEGRMAPGINGGFVLLGARTSKYGKKKMAEFITFMYAEGIERGVQWSEKSKEHVDRYGVKL